MNLSWFTTDKCFLINNEKNCLILFLSLLLLCINTILDDIGVFLTTCYESVRFQPQINFIVDCSSFTWNCHGNLWRSFCEQVRKYWFSGVGTVEPLLFSIQAACRKGFSLTAT